MHVTISTYTMKKEKEGYVRPVAEGIALEVSNVLCESGDFRGGDTQEYDFGDTSGWDF